MISGLPMSCSEIAVGTLRSQSVHLTTYSANPTSTFFKLPREPLSFMVCGPQMLATRIQSVPTRGSSKALEISNGKRLATVTKMDTMSMNLGCFLSVPMDAKILLPLLSKVLGYSIIASSAVGKLPQVPASSFVI